MGDLKCAVVGMGLGRVFADEFAESPQTKQVALCDSDPRRLDEVQRELPIAAHTYTDLDDMLARQCPDVVAVVTPDHYHREHAQKCLEAGCHVLLTKPIATTREDAEAIAEAAEAAGRILMVAHERRFRSHARAIRELLDNGTLGEIIAMRLDALHDKRDQFARSPWYAAPEAKRTVLTGSAIHEIDLMRYFAGAAVAAVSAAGNRLGELQFPLDTTVGALFTFANGAIGQVTATYQAHWPADGPIDDQFRLIGTKGIVIGNKVSYDGSSQWHDLPVDKNPIVAGCRGAVRAFIEAVMGEGPNPVPPLEAIRSLAAALAANEAAAGGRQCVPFAT